MTAADTRPALRDKDAPDLGTFTWQDPFRIADQLTEEERLIADSARAYAQEKLQPRVTQAFQSEETDPGIFREMGEMGLLGTTIPEEYGGIGAGYVTYGLGRARGRAGRFRLSLDDVRPEFAGHVPDLCLRK